MENKELQQFRQEFQQFKQETKEESQQLRQEFQQFREEVHQFQAKTEAEFSDIRETLAVLKRSTLLIEDYVTNKIPVLFDAYSINQEEHENYDHKFENLESVTDTHSIKLSILENTSKIHSEQLAKLTS